MRRQFQLDWRDDRTATVRRCLRVAAIIAWVTPLWLGCGINKSRLATEQLVVSDAVDKTVASIDFSPLSGRKVFFDTQYLDGVNLGPNGNIKYVVSSLRQQMLAEGLPFLAAADLEKEIADRKRTRA
jgi:hypothetical protein